MMDTKPNPKRRRLNGKRGGWKKKAPTPCHTPVQTEPIVATDAKAKPGMDALVLPDVKPDVKSLGDDIGEESFATRVAKGSGWILIDKYSTPKSLNKVKTRLRHTDPFDPKLQNPIIKLATNTRATGLQNPTIL